MKKSMSKFIYMAVIGALTFFPLTTFAFTAKTGETVSLSAEEPIEDNVYIAAGSIVSTSEVVGDLYAAGGNVIITSDVSADLNVAGGNVQIDGNLGQDVRAAGGTVTINSAVGGELILTGGSVIIGADTVVADDAVIAGGEVQIIGDLLGEVEITAGVVRIFGVIGSGTITAEEVYFEPGSSVSGELTYKAREEATMLPVGDGVVSFELNEKIYVAEKNLMPLKEIVGMAAGIFWGLGFLISIIFVWVVSALFKKDVSKMIVFANKEFGKSLLWGGLSIPIIALVAFFLFISVLGAGVGVFFVTLTALVAQFGKVVGILLLGSMLFRLVKKDFTIGTISPLLIILSVTIVFIFKLIPVVGWLTNMIFVLVGFGAVWHSVYTKVVGKGKKK